MEQQIIDWLIEEFPSRRPVMVGIGDDGAVVRSNEADLVFSTDTICDGVHFDSSVHSAKQIGRKALAVNLSDLAAMGATPLAAVVGLTLPVTCEFDYVKQLFHGLKLLAERFNIQICGGDTTVWPGKLAITISVIGAAPASGVWQIDGARVGDLVVVTGQFGGSLAGRHLEFEPRIDFALKWAERDVIRAATDASDSLSLDLQKMAKASGVGFELVSDKIPISNDAVEMASGSAAGQTALDHALFDGEDFELILAVDPNDVAMLLHVPSDVKLSMIGRFTDDQMYWLVSGDDRAKLVPRGFRHDFASDASSQV